MWCSLFGVGSLLWNQVNLKDNGWSARVSALPLSSLTRSFVRSSNYGRIGLFVFTVRRYFSFCARLDGEFTPHAIMPLRASLEAHIRDHENWNRKYGLRAFE